MRWVNIYRVPWMLKRNHRVKHIELQFSNYYGLFLTALGCVYLLQTQARNKVANQLVSKCLQGIKVSQVVLANGAAWEDRSVASKEDV